MAGEKSSHALDVTKNVLDIFADGLSQEPANYLLAVAAIIPDHNEAALRFISIDDPSLEEKLTNQLLHQDHPWGEFGTDSSLAEAAIPLILEKHKDEDWFSVGDSISALQCRCYYITVHVGVSGLRDIVVLGFATRPASGGLLPWSLRRLASDVAFQVRQHLGGISSIDLANEAFAVRDTTSALHAISDMTHAAGMILWLYSRDEMEFRFLDGFGPVGGSYVVPLGGSHYDGRTEGIVGQVRPERGPVVYIVGDPAACRPAIENWWPHDPTNMSRNRWNACVAWPIVSNGDLLGALSAYAANIGDLRIEKHILDRAANTCREYLRANYDEERMDRIEYAYGTELTRASSGALATEFIHDFKKSIEQVDDLLNVLSPQMVRRPRGEQELFKAAHQSVAFLSRLTKNLQVLSRGGPRAGRCRANDAIEANRTLLTSVARVENGRVQVDFRLDPVRDPDQSTTIAISEFSFLRILINLVRNAGYWTNEARHPRITVQLVPGTIETKRASGRPLSIRVTDNGAGVSEDDIGRIFARGFTTRGEAGGSGLGLHIVRQIVNSAGGDLRVWSEPHTHTAFQLWIPVGPSKGE